MAAGISTEQALDFVGGSDAGLDFSAFTVGANATALAAGFAFSLAAAHIERVVKKNSSMVF
jgi:hypothetical protein